METYELVILFLVGVAIGYGISYVRNRKQSPTPGSPSGKRATKGKRRN